MLRSMLGTELFGAKLPHVTRTEGGPHVEGPVEESNLGTTISLTTVLLREHAGTSPLGR